MATVKKQAEKELLKRAVYRLVKNRPFMLWRKFNTEDNYFTQAIFKFGGEDFILLARHYRRGRARRMKIRSIQIRHRKEYRVASKSELAAILREVKRYLSKTHATPARRKTAPAIAPLFVSN